VGGFADRQYRLTRIAFLLTKIAPVVGYFELVSDHRYNTLDAKKIRILKDMFHQTHLQRYMPGERALKVLEDEGLYLRRIDEYPDDPTEGEREHFGRNEERILEILNMQVPESLRMSQQEAAILSHGQMVSEKKDQFIQSWYWDEHMSRFMWDNYGGYTKSTDCVLFVADRLKLGDYLDDVLPVGYRFEPVKYVLNKQGQKEAFFTKNPEFGVEKEYRVALDVRQLIFFNQKILPEFNWIKRHEGRDVSNEGANYRNGGVASENLFRHIDDAGFILSVPFTRLLAAVLIPEDASSEFATRIDELLLIKGSELKAQRVRVSESKA